MWSDRQVVPDGSRCYIPIFDGLVNVERGDDDYDRYLDEKHRWSGKKDGMI